MLQEDIEKDKRGRGGAYLAAHPLAEGELVASPYVYHSRASCIEGDFLLLPSRAAYLATMASSGSGGAGCGRAAGGSSAGRGNAGGMEAGAASAGVGSAAADAAPADGRPAYFCRRAWDPMTGAVVKGG